MKRAIKASAVFLAILMALAIPQPPGVAVGAAPDTSYAAEEGQGGGPDSGGAATVTAKTIKLDKNYCGSAKASTSDGMAHYYLGEIPENKIVVASIETSNRSNANTYIIGGMTLTNSRGRYMNYRGNSSARTCMIYFIVARADEYTLNIANNWELSPPRKYTVNIYTADYITAENAFTKLDASGGSPGEINNYLIFNAPEHLSSTGQLGDNHRYISKLQVRGDANIYWEHLNEYGRRMVYGLLLYNGSRAAADVTINKKSAYHTGSMPRLEIPVQIWDDYYLNRVMPDSTGITSGGGSRLTIGPGESEWIYLDPVSASSDGLFNGIINLTAKDNVRLDCYAFTFDCKMLSEGDENEDGAEVAGIGDGAEGAGSAGNGNSSGDEADSASDGEGVGGADGTDSMDSGDGNGDGSGADSGGITNSGSVKGGANAISVVENDFNVGDRRGDMFKSNGGADGEFIGSRAGISGYSRADGGYGELSGATDGPVLVSGEIDLSGRDSYRLILAGDDAPLFNAGEDMPLYYNGKAVSPKYTGNARNYAVIYRISVSGFSGSKVTFELNGNTNPNYSHNPDCGIYMAYAVWDGGRLYDRGYHTLLQQGYHGYSIKAATNRPLPGGRFTIDIVVSGMSALPLTVIME